MTCAWHWSPGSSGKERVLGDEVRATAILDRAAHLVVEQLEHRLIGAGR